MDFFVHKDIEQAGTIPSQFYKDPKVFAEARDRVFTPSWQFVGDTDLVKIPGQTYPFILLEGLLDEPLVFTRDLKDELRLLSNVCTHRAMTVVESAGNERYLRCRYHGRRFGLDGCFQHMPEFENVCNFPSPKDDLVHVPWGAWNKLLFASVAPKADLSHHLKPVQNRLHWLPLHEFHHVPNLSRDYLVRANWALYVDNYLEGFHIPFIHAGLNDILDYDNYVTELFEHGNLQVAMANSGEGCFDLPPSSPDFGKRVSAYYYWLFPNTMLNFYPWGLSVNVVKPLAPDLTRVSFLCYVWKEDLLNMGAGASLDRVEREDEVVVEAVQRGVRSRFYDLGRFSPRREQNVHHFHRLLSEALS